MSLLSKNNILLPTGASTNADQGKWRGAISEGAGSYCQCALRGWLE